MNFDKMPVIYDDGGYRVFGKYYRGIGIHLGHDFHVKVKTPVCCKTDGIVKTARMMSGFGGSRPNQNGGCVIIYQKDKNGHFFYGLYGHIVYNVHEGDLIKPDQCIGYVHEYYAGAENVSHLHFGISSKDTLPLSPYGYAQSIEEMNQEQWTNPIEFCQQNI